MPNTVNAAVLAFEEWLSRGDATRRVDIQQYRDFYDGAHDLIISPRQSARLNITTRQIHALANVCPLVIDVVSERLSIARWDAKAPATINTVMGWWSECDLDSQQDDVHLSSLRDGDGYLIVDWDAANERPVFHHNLADDGYNGAGIVYASANRTPLYGYKRWRLEEGDDVGNTRLNLYYPDRIERYITGRAGLWAQYQEPDDTGWPAPWVDAGGNPLGVPVIHFPTNPNGNDYGTSELEAILPLQRVLTSLWIDLLAAADATGFQIVTLTGDAPDEEMIAAPRSIWFSRSPAAAWGNIPPGDLSLLVEAIRHTTMTIAQVSRVPLTMFQDTKAVSSSDTIIASERGLTAKVNDRAKTYGLAWREAMRMAIRLHNAFGPRPTLDDTGIKPQWDSFEQVDHLAVEERRAAVAAQHVMSGLGLTAAYTLAGYSREEIETIRRTDTYGDEGLTQ